MARTTGGILIWCSPAPLNVRSAHVDNLEIVLTLTPQLLARSRVVAPSASRRRASFFWCGVSFGLRPSFKSFATTRAAFDRN